MTPPLLLNDRLLIEEILAGLESAAGRLFTTPCWYYRACRAAVLGTSRHLSGPFEQLPIPHQESAVLALLQLPERIGFADPRDVVPAMASLSGRHRQLNLLNLEAAATASVLGATVLLSPPAADGILPAVLDAEGVAWDVHAVN